MSEQRNPQFDPRAGDVIENMFGNLVRVVSVDQFGEVTFQCPPGSSDRYCSHDTWALFMAASEVHQLAEDS